MNFIKRNHDSDHKHLCSFPSYILLLSMVLIVSFFTSPCQGADVTLSWDESQNADYYVLYWGAASGNYTLQSEAISVTTYQVVGLQSGTTYYFSVKAFNSCGNSSDFSDAVTYTGLADSAPASPVQNSTIPYKEQ